MDFINCRTDLPVLLIHNLDPSWPRHEIQENLAETFLLIDSLVGVGHPLKERCIQSSELAMALDGFSPDEYLIFNWCEELPGVPHSEYRVAQILDQMGFTYTGAGAQALRLSQDKRLVKGLLEKHEIPTPIWQVYTMDQTATKWERFPAIVKPAFEHCGYGISREAVVQTEEELTKQVHYILNELQQPALVEDFIDGREFHVGVIGNGKLLVLPPAEIDYSQFDDIHDRLCTYEANFDKTSRAYQLTLPKLPAVLDDNELAELEAVVTAAYQVTNCRDYARMDVRLRDGIFYILDVNHNADISSDNSLVMAAALVGWSYGRLGSILINLAAQRHPIFSSAFH